MAKIAESKLRELDLQMRAVWDRYLKAREQLREGIEADDAESINDDLGSLLEIVAHSIAAAV